MTSPTPEACPQGPKTRSAPSPLQGPAQALPQGLQVVCLCAAWCRLCDSYATVFAEVCARVGADMPGLRWRWLDIEDEADLCGDLDIETFPTIVVCGPRGVHFAGAVTPQPATLERVLRAALAGGPVNTDAAYLALASRLA